MAIQATRVHIITLFISDICQKCQFLQVSLSNDVMAKQYKSQDTYELSETINGKPRWESVTKSIWYYPPWQYWIIGSISDIGTTTGAIHSLEDTEYHCPQQVPRDKWNYWDGSNWQEARSNDIIIQCVGKKELDQRNL